MFNYVDIASEMVEDNLELYTINLGESCHNLRQGEVKAELADDWSAEEERGAQTLDDGEVGGELPGEAGSVQEHRAEGHAEHRFSRTIAPVDGEGVTFVRVPSLPFPAWRAGGSR